MKILLLLAQFADFVEVIPFRYIQRIQRRKREVSRRRQQFGCYFSWYNLNSQMVVKEARKHE